MKRLREQQKTGVHGGEAINEKESVKNLLYTSDRRRKSERELGLYAARQ